MLNLSLGTQYRGERGGLYSGPAGCQNKSIGIDMALRRSWQSRTKENQKYHNYNVYQPLVIYGLSSNFKVGGSILARGRPFGFGKKFKGNKEFPGE